MKVRLYINDDGYIDGWGSDYTDDNQYDISDEELQAIYLDASKLVDGHIILDTDKQKEIEAEANKVTPTPEQQMINTLGLQNAKLIEQVAELTKKLGGDS